MRRSECMGVTTILLIILILILLGVIPAWPHSRGWGYGPSGIVGVIAVILLVLLLLGRIYEGRSSGTFALTERPASA